MIKQNTKSKYDNSNHTKLVVSRKLNHPELIFNEGNQKSDQIRNKHMDLENGRQKWSFKFNDDECYVCGKYPYVQVFFTRRKADIEYDEIKDQKTISMLRKMYKLDENEEDAYKTCPLIFGSILGDRFTRMILAKHQAALIFAYEEA